MKNCDNHPLYAFVLHLHPFVFPFILTFFIYMSFFLFILLFLYIRLFFLFILMFFLFILERLLLLLACVWQALLACSYYSSQAIFLWQMMMASVWEQRYSPTSAELGLFALPLLLHQNHPEKLFRLNSLMMIALLHFMQAYLGRRKQKLCVIKQKSFVSEKDLFAF